MGRRVALLLGAPASAEQTVTALTLADRLLARGHRVTVFAQGAATDVAAGEGAMSEAVAALLRQGLHGGTLDWVVDAATATRKGILDTLVPGVIPGDHADLWAFVREADVVLSVGG